MQSPYRHVGIVIRNGSGGSPWVLLRISLNLGGDRPLSLAGPAKRLCYAALMAATTTQKLAVALAFIAGALSLVAVAVTASRSGRIDATPLFGGLFMLLFWVLIIALIVALVVWIVNQTQRR